MVFVWFGCLKAASLLKGTVFSCALVLELRRMTRSFVLLFEAPYRNGSSATEATSSSELYALPLRVLVQSYRGNPPSTQISAVTVGLQESPPPRLDMNA
eukprot:4613065-Amphidinium_carterae.1